MGTFTASVSNFSLTSTWKIVLDKSGWVMYPTPNTGSADKTFYFTGIPAGSVINSATLTATMNSPATGAALRTVDGGSFSGSKSVSITPGGSNTFRFRFKANGTTSAPYGDRSSTLSFSNVTITVDYTPPGESGGTPPPPSSYIGAMNVSPTTVTAGGSINIAVGACDANIGRHIIIYRTDAYGILNAVATYHGSAAESWNVYIPVDWCSYSPNDTLFQIRVEYRTYDIFSGLDTGTTNQMVDVYVPGSVVPTMSDFTATRGANGVNAAITNYVQNYSKVTLAMEGVAGAYGSGIASYKISGGGMTAYTQSATFGPFSQTGDIVFTAVVTDTRGRTATSSVTISVLAYSPPSFSIPEAWRSNYDGVKNQKGTYVRLKSGVSFSSLDEQNEVTLKGRVYLKGGEAPAWEDMTPDTELILGGGALLFTRTYIAQIQVTDLLENRITEFVIPTKRTGISIMAGMQGIAFGKSAEVLGATEFGWPIYNCPYEVGDVLQTLNTSSPEDRWPGTEWEAITGRVLVGLDAAQTEFDTAGEEGGSKTVHLGLESGYAKVSSDNYSGDAYITYNAKTGVSWSTDREVKVPAGVDQTTSQAKTTGISLGGTTDSGSNLQPYKVVYMWMRTA